MDEANFTLYPLEFMSCIIACVCTHNLTTQYIHTRAQEFHVH